MRTIVSTTVEKSSHPLLPSCQEQLIEAIELAGEEDG